VTLMVSGKQTDRADERDLDMVDRLSAVVDRVPAGKPSCVRLA
jgi:hypothetical protein